MARAGRRLLLAPRWRYSRGFLALTRLLRYSPQEEALRLVMQYVAQSELARDYLEFGVWQGQSFAVAFHLARLHGLAGMRFYAFDSFQGLPPSRGVDLEGGAPFGAGQLDPDITATPFLRYGWNGKGFLLHRAGP